MSTNEELIAEARHEASWLDRDGSGRARSARLMRSLADALEAALPKEVQTVNVSRCEYCRHAPHGPVCFNMASDNECSCRHAQTLTPERKRL